MLKTSLKNIIDLFERIIAEKDASKRKILINKLNKYLETSYTEEEFIINKDFDKKTSTPPSILDLQRHGFHSLY